MNEKPKFTQKKLKNGIMVLHEKRNLPVVSVCIANPFAAAHEPTNIKGIAHFIEHLLFTGTKNRSHEDISKEIEKRGGILNAFTSQDATWFMFKLPSEHLFTGLDILSDMLNNPLFNPEKFEKEKKVILEEIKMYHDIPQYDIYDQLLANLYEAPFGLGITGKKETITLLTRDFVADFYSKKYSSENYVVTIVGNADFKKVCDYLEKTFKPGKIKLAHQKIKKKTSESIEERPGIDQAHFLFGVHAPLSTEKAYQALLVLDAYLAYGMSSKLFLEIREKRGLAYNIKSSLNTEKNYSYYSIYVGTTKPAIPEVKKLILQGFKDIKNITPKDLKQAKQQLIGLRKVHSEESTHVMNELLFEHIETGNAQNYYDYENQINSVTLDEVKALAKEMIKNYSTAAIVPK